MAGIVAPEVLRSLGRDSIALFLLPILALGLHAVCLTQYGFFRDELYYLACASRLDWGYVDHPPFFVALVWAMTKVFGASLVAVRLPLAFASAGTVALTMATARRMGARGWAVWLAGLFPLLSGMFLVLFHLGTMNGIDVFFWAVAAWLLVRIFERATWPLWISLGVLFGIGLLNKASMAWLMCGLLLGVLVSDRRKLLASPQPYVAAALGIGLWIPHIVWQAHRNWPTTEFLRNAQRLKMVPVPPWEFLAQQAVVMNLAAVPFLAYGAWWALRDKGEGRRWLPFVVVTLGVALFLLLNGRSRVNYLAPAYTFLFPVAAVATQRLFERRRIHPAWALAPVTVVGLSTVPLGLPILPVQMLITVVAATPIQPPTEERGERSPIQGYADMFGWPEMAREAFDAYMLIPKDERPRSVVITRNYGEAAAIERFWPGPKPAPVVSGHNQYYLWGPGDWDGRAAVFVNGPGPELARYFREVRQVGRTSNRLAVPEEGNAPISLALGLREPVPVFWDRLKRFR